MLLHALSRFTPPPTYLTMPCVGVDISDTSLKYVAFEPGGHQGDLHLATWGSIDIPSGVLSRGQVVDPAQLVTVLQQCKERIGGEFVRVSLPEERAYLFETQIKANVPRKEIKGLLEFRLEENVPIPSREVLFDFALLPQSSQQTSVAPVVVAAYARETIMTYYDACVASGLRPAAFEVEAQAMARAVVPTDAAGATMLVDFGKTRTGIGVVYRGTLMYTATVDVGGAKLSQAMRSQLGAEMSETQLTELKNTIGLEHAVDDTTVRDTLLPEITALKDELATRMQYWHTSAGGDQTRRITSIRLCGGSSNLKGLPAHLTNELGVPVARGNVWQNVFSLDTHVPPIDIRHSYGYTTAIGLALGGRTYTS